jgi:hypothetical protein
MKQHSLHKPKPDHSEFIIVLVCAATTAIGLALFPGGFFVGCCYGLELRLRQMSRLEKAQALKLTLVTHCSGRPAAMAAAETDDFVLRLRDFKNKL